MKVSEIEAAAAIRIKSRWNPGRTIRAEMNSRTEAIAVANLLRADGKTVKVLRATKTLMITDTFRKALTPSTSVNYLIEVRA